jgi:hypothetical protein
MPSSAIGYIRQGGNERADTSTTLLRSGNRKSYLVPVHILKTKAVDLTDAQPLDSKQEQDGPVVDVGFSIRFCTGQEPLDVRP